MKKQSTAILLAFFLGGCVKNPFIDIPHTQALVRSNYPIVTLNGEPPPDAFRVQLAPGPHQMAVKYSTLTQTYLCQFEWRAEPKNVYEVVRDQQREALTLYTWVRVNPLWASRTHPVAPQECSGHTAEKQ